MSIKIQLFRAQALDNDTSASCEWLGVNLETDTATTRQEAMSYASNISLNGKNLFSESWVNVYKYKNIFLLEMPSIEKDAAGRIATLICCGEITKPINDRDIDIVLSAFKAFAVRINRQIDTKTMEIAKIALRKLKKNTFQLNSVATTGLMWWVILIVTIAIYFLIK